MSQPFLAEIKMFGGNFAPRGFAFCNGQILSIAQNTALFSLLGTTYGGDGRTTFGLPNLQGRVPVHFGTGPGLPNVDLGETGGSPTATLNVTNLPAHSHTLAGNAAVPCFNGAGTLDSPANAVPAGSASAENYAPAASANGSLANAPVSGNTANTGNNQPFSIMQPYLGVSFIIALQGIFPSRN